MRDSGSGPKEHNKEQPGIGLANSRARLQGLYGDRARLTLNSAAEPISVKNAETRQKNRVRIIANRSPQESYGIRAHQWYRFHSTAPELLFARRSNFALL